MRRLTATFLFLFAAACGSGNSSDRPNVLFVVWDTVRADRCSVNGYERPTTPVLESVASSGVTYRNAWSPAGWTAPAHASMFTGLRPEKHGLLLDNRMDLDQSAVTLAELLDGAGYRTACLTNNMWIGPEFGICQGFRWIETLADQVEPGYPTCRWAHDQALELAKEARDQGAPFFIFLNLMEAHLNYTPFAPHEEGFVRGDPGPELLAAGRAFDTPDAVNHITGIERVDPALVPLLSDLYDAEIAGLDAEFANLVNGMAEAGLLENTLLIVASDHGENLGEHDLYTHKISLHRTVRHVPLVLRLPGRFEGGRKVEDVVRLEDIFPTVLEVCGLEAPEGIDGETLLAKDISGRVSRAAWGRTGGDLEVPESEPGVDLTPFTVSIRTVFDGRYHLIRDSGGKVELYDLETDRQELVNLAGERPEILLRLGELLPEP